LVEDFKRALALREGFFNYIEFSPIFVLNSL